MLDTVGFLKDCLFSSLIILKGQISHRVATGIIREKKRLELSRLFQENKTAQGFEE